MDAVAARVNVDAADDLVGLVEDDVGEPRALHELVGVPLQISEGSQPGSFRAASRTQISLAVPDGSLRRAPTSRYGT
jgi:hypothetical protein